MYTASEEDGPGSSQWDQAIGQEAISRNCTDAQKAPPEHEEEPYNADDCALEHC